MFKKITGSILAMTLGSAILMGLAHAGAKPAEASLYDRLGGYNAIVAVVDDLVARLADDKQLGRFWAHRGDDGIAREKQLIVDFVANQAGGDLYYTGRDMKISHVGMRISESDWDIFMNHLNATLDKFELPAKERQDVIDFMASTKADMVEVQ